MGTYMLCDGENFFIDFKILLRQNYLEYNSYKQGDKVHVETFEKKFLHNRNTYLGRVKCFLQNKFRKLDKS